MAATNDETTLAKTHTQSREQFVRHLRDKARQAAEASVHHASMSEQYLELSQKFSLLAENAGSAQLADLQQNLRQLETMQPAGIGSSDQLNSSVQSETPTAELPAPHAVGFQEAASQPAIADDASVSHAPSSPSVPSAKSSRTKKRKPTTRKIVERARAARLAIKERVRVKAKKSDLQPKQRSATEELSNSKGSLATSMGLFALAVFLLSLVTYTFEPEVQLNPIMAAFASEVTNVEEPLPVETPEEEQGEQTEQDVEEPVEEEQPEPEPEPEVQPEPEPIMEPPAEQPSEMAELLEEMTPEAENGDVAVADAANVDMTAVDNRSDAGRAAMLQKFGGSQASESAVQRGLEWLVSVQHPKGYWDFVNVGPSGNAGSINNPIGGTAYALLPFLAAGQTHQSGSFQKQVQAGISYLTTIGVKAPAGYDLRGMINKSSDDKAPNEAYYVHGAATLALCEAYGMTKDRRMKKACEGAVKFIVNSQDPRGGGWRYNPQEPGSTSVTAIQVMALMSAKKAGIKIPESTFKGIMHYLDSVQVDKAGRYGYEIQKKTYSGAVTSMALLCRMYLGWGRDDGDMRAGVALLDKAGPYENLYSLYFATQVMKNWGGKEWERWNVRMRDDLVAVQETEGPAAGSWAPRTGALHGKQGGRLLSTALATLTLEVYYRYKPLLPEVDAAK